MGVIEDLQAELSAFRRLVLRAIATSSHVRMAKRTSDPAALADGDEWIRTDTDSRYVRMGGQTVLLGTPTATAHARLHSIVDPLDHVAGTLGDILYAGTAGAWALLAGNATTTKKFLTQTGDSSDSAAPTWGTVEASDLPFVGYISFGMDPINGQVYLP